MDETLTLEKKDSFVVRLSKENIKVDRGELKILQVNIGNLCNLTCTHCHVEAGPKGKNNMVKKEIDRILELLKQESSIHTVDITGGAPEMNPHFRYFVEEITKMKKKVIDRCNLTVLFLEDQLETAEFLAKYKVEIVASLPCYSRENVDKQRGDGIFDDSIKALQLLNKLGYGKEDTGLILNLVYNPVGPHLPPNQEQLTADYTNRLKEDFDIVFNNLFTITNMPIKRYVNYLKREKRLVEYMQLLIDSFNPNSVSNIMCTELVSISYDGYIFDCDFNQMLEIPVSWEKTSIWDINRLSDISSKIAFKDHCYGCTAGAGSSCGGALM